MHFHFPPPVSYINVHLTSYHIFHCDVAILILNVMLVSSTVALLFALALGFTRATALPQSPQLLPCDSLLRLIFPHLFTHCSDCSYTEWSDWEKVQYNVPTSQCPSGKAFIEQRTRAISSGIGCIEPLTETKRAVCKLLYIIQCLVSCSSILTVLCKR